jgi:hypothetical protein
MNQAKLMNDRTNLPLLTNYLVLSREKWVGGNQEAIVYYLAFKSFVDALLALSMLITKYCLVSVFASILVASP